MSNFAFLQSEWPQVHEAASRAESLVYPDPRAACFYARRALELAVQWLYKAESKLTLPYQDNLAALLAEPSFQALGGSRIATRTRLIKDLGNRAVHTQKVITQYDGLTACRELFQVCYWVAHTYGRGARPAPQVAFNDALLPKTSPVPPQTQKKLEEQAASLTARDESLAVLLRDKEALDAEIVALRAEVAAATAANRAQPDTHDYNEAETRDAFIDLLLKEAGWELTQPGKDTEYEVHGMPNNHGVGYADYVLWGDDGKPLAVVEAKRTRRNPTAGQQQAKLYADCLENQTGQRPLIFYTNGYEHWLWDDTQYPPRPVQGFYTRDELKLAVERRTMRRPLIEVKTDEAICGRFYQERAIRKIADAFDRKQRKALLVMATGSGKTRTVIGLCDVLQRANWVKRVLFLADRNALVKQAVNAFKKHLPASSPVNLVSERDENGRTYVCTYQTMMGLIDEMKNGQRRFGPGYFDLVVIDEAHRSVYKKFGGIFRYFDSFLIGLTATPKDEIDRNTYGLFDLENGVPTDEYSLDAAIRDGMLVPPVSFALNMQFPREGIRYDDLDDDEKEEWDELDWNEEGEVPDRVNAEAVNRWLFNTDTVDKVLEALMTRGHKVAGGDRLGKTIIFAKNHQHAEFIVQRFDKHYPHHAGHFARVIDFKVEYSQSLIDSFSAAEKQPHIAISVDMLDTGIDVPEVVNLVFFKPIRSKTKFWQMMGRGTRLCQNLYGPGKDKQNFYVFDVCGNLEFFSQPVQSSGAGTSPGLNERIFGLRVELIGELDRTRRPEDALAELRQETATRLREVVAAMPVDNFLVRDKRRLVEKYSDPAAWEELDVAAQGELTREVAGLPSVVADADLEAKQFDVLMLNLQLAVLRVEARFEELKGTVIELASAMEEKQVIPMVGEQLELIQEVQTTQFWQGVTVSELENVRQRLRALVKFIDKRRRTPVYTHFEDELRSVDAVQLPVFTVGVDPARFREKALAFLREHMEQPALHKVRWNEPLTPEDLIALEKMFVDAGVAPKDELEKVVEQEGGLGLLVRSLIGLDRGAAKNAFSRFIATRTLTATQLDFVNLVVDHLTQCGWMRPEQLYSSPFTDQFAAGPNSVFSHGPSLQELIGVLTAVRENATGPREPQTLSIEP
ncbi:MAG TPA: DEAD/DEAH box helicase family protein [Terracidiphilus sp.]|jgi:type I restriction enzyme R subunit